MPSFSATIAIIGAGSVGSSIAHSLLLRRLVGELILVDIDQPRCRAQVLDLSDASYLSHVRVKHGDYISAGQADIIIITAGAKQNPGETRLNLVDRNFKILKSVLGGMQPLRSDAVLLLVANPVDVLTHFAQKLSGLPRGQVLGSGTLLDSIRLRGQIAEKLGVGLLGVLLFEWRADGGLGRRLQYQCKCPRRAWRFSIRNVPPSPFFIALFTPISGPLVIRLCRRCSSLDPTHAHGGRTPNDRNDHQVESHGHHRLQRLHSLRHQCSSDLDL